MYPLELNFHLEKVISVAVDGIAGYLRMTIADETAVAAVDAPITAAPPTTPPKLDNVDMDDDGDEDDGEEEDVADATAGGDAAAKKKRKKKKKNKKKAAAGAEGGDAAAAPGGGAMQGAKAAAGGAKVQTDPPSVPVRLLFPSGTYPEGERQSYKADNLWRETSAEKREQERLNWDMINQVCGCVWEERGMGCMRMGVCMGDQVSHSWEYDACISDVHGYGGGDGIANTCHWTTSSCMHRNQCPLSMDVHIHFRTAGPAGGRGPPPSTAVHPYHRQTRCASGRHVRVAREYGAWLHWVAMGVLGGQREGSGTSE